MKRIKVSSSSRAAAAAGAIAGIIREHESVEIVAIGVGATNQAVKALALATSMLKKEDVLVASVIEYTHVQIDENDRTALKFIVDRIPHLN